MEVLSIQPAGIQVTIRMPLEEISKIVSIADKIEIRFNSGDTEEVDAKDCLVEHLKALKRVHDDIGA